MLVIKAAVLRKNLSKGNEDDIHMAGPSGKGQEW